MYNQSNKNNRISKKELPITILYFSVYTVIALSLLIRQPFGNPPDEINRYLIPQYIAETGSLPNGYDEAIRIPSYGFSYAFQPILPYMIQGYAMRLVMLFTDSQTALFYTARGIDFLFGLVMAYYVLKLGRKWFSQKPFQYLFSFLVSFLPQAIFLHTYINTDSCCMMSIAMMLYGLTLCLEDDFSYGSCTLMSVGIICCALSYYNAYGFILSCILIFFAYFLKKNSSKKYCFDIKSCIRKGLFISVLVLLGISWWFIRSYLLYDGDFLGLRTRDLCGALYGNENMKPGVRVTYQSSGYTVLSMLLRSDFLVLSVNSLIAMYGPMIVTTARWIYRFYKALLAGGFLLGILSVLPSKKGLTEDIPSGLRHRPTLRIFFHLNLLMCIILPLILSIIYSYGTDYQPQGRYLMPMLIPLMYYVTRGIHLLLNGIRQLINRQQNGPAAVNDTVASLLTTGPCVLLMLLILIALFVTVYGYAFPYYAALGLQ